MKIQKKIGYIIIFSSIFINPLNLGITIKKEVGFSFNNNVRLKNSVPYINLSKLPPIDYKTIYEEWYHPKTEMLIITPNNESFINAVKPLAKWKNEKGVKTIVLNNFSLYSGRDKAEKIRNMIKDFYQRENVQWVLLAGDATDDLIPTRYVYNPDTVEYNGYDEYYKPTDFYYADLTGSWDDDGDGNWGESSQYNSQGRDEINWVPEVYVGRLPASTPLELEIMVNKTLNYEKNPFIGEWMNQMLLAGGISSYTPPEDETRLSTYILQNYIQSKMNYTHLCEYTSSYTPPDPKEALNHGIFLDHFNAGYSTVFFAGHGNPNNFFRNPSGGIAYTNSDAAICNNSKMPSLVYAFACTTSPADQNDNNIGELLIKKDNAGAIGYIGGWRITWYFEDDASLEKLNRGNAKLFWKEFFEENTFQQGKALYDSKVAYMNSDYFDSPSVSMRLEYERKNVLTYCLLGDPELDVYTNQPVAIQNHFIQEIYEGQNISIPIKNVNNKPISNARVRLSSSGGFSRTFYTNDEGILKFTVPALNIQTYNVCITGHNSIPSYFNFNLKLDDIVPEINSLTMTPDNPNRNSTLYFSVNATDLHSKIESVYLILSNDNFLNYWIYPIENSMEGNNLYEFYIDGLNPGTYSYLTIARDYANNTNFLYNVSNTFKIKGNSKELLLFLLVSVFSSLVGVIGITTFIIYKIHKRNISLKREWEINAVRIRKKERLDKLRKKKRI